MEAVLPTDRLISEFDSQEQEQAYLDFLKRQVEQGRQSGNLSSEASRLRVRAALREKYDV